MLPSLNRCIIFLIPMGTRYELLVLENVIYNVLGILKECKHLTLAWKSCAEKFYKHHQNLSTKSPYRQKRQADMYLHIKFLQYFI